MKLMTGIYGTGQSDWVLGSSKGPEGSPACHHVMVMVMVVVGDSGWPAAWGSSYLPSAVAVFPRFDNYRAALVTVIRTSVLLVASMHRVPIMRQVLSEAP